MRRRGFVLLPVAPLPSIDVPAIFVSAQSSGRQPGSHGGTVATPLERHLGAIADVDDMTSTSGVGTTSIQLTFGIDRDIDGAARDVQAAIVAAHADLPTSLTSNPYYRKLNSPHFPVMAIAMTSDVLTQGQIYDAADAVISQRLSQTPGRRRSQRQRQRAAGGARRAQSACRCPSTASDCRMCVRPFRMPTPIRRKARSNRIDLHYQIYTNDNARDAGPYRDLIIANRNGATVRLGDVATVLDMQDGATENIRTYGLYNGKPAMFGTGFPAARREHRRDRRCGQGGAAASEASIDPKIDLVVTSIARSPSAPRCGKWSRRCCWRWPW